MSNDASENVGAQTAAASAASHTDLHAPEAAPFAFDRLPDGVLSVVLQFLGLQHAAAARAVCRSWREAVEAIQWRRLDVVGKGLMRPERLVKLLVDPAVGHGVEEPEGDPAVGAKRRWIRVAPGASLRVEMGSEAYMKASLAKDWADWFQTAVALVAACVAAASGGLGEVSVECVYLVGGDAAALEALLLAIVPLGAAACPALRSFKLLCNFADGSGGVPFPLEPRLRPLSNLEVFALPRCWYVDRPAADAVGRSLPRLKRLGITLGGFEAAGGLAGAASLQYLKARSSGGSASRPHCPDAGPLLEGLASGPAALSLKELCFEGRLSAAALRVLPRLAALELLSGSLTLGPDLDRADLGALRLPPALRGLGTLRLSRELERDGAALAGALEGLAGALAACPRPRPSPPALTLILADAAEAAPPEANALAGLSALARAARGELSLELPVDLRPGRPTEAAAALSDAPLRNLRYLKPGIIHMLLLVVDVSEEAARGGWADGLSAFAGCSCSGGLEIRLRALRPYDSTNMYIVEEEAAGHAFRLGVWAAVARALPAARILTSP
eukprot:tig00020828_g14367.t1